MTLENSETLTPQLNLVHGELLVSLYDISDDIKCANRHLELAKDWNPKGTKPKAKATANAESRLRPKFPGLTPPMPCGGPNALLSKATFRPTRATHPLYSVYKGFFNCFDNSTHYLLIYIHFTMVESW